MSEIKRYDPMSFGPENAYLTEDATGDAVKYDDHVAVVAAKDAEIEALQTRLTAVEHSVRVGSDVDHERDYLAMEARRYASHYPEASDGRNTFILFAEMIEGRSTLKGDAA